MLAEASYPLQSPGGGAWRRASLFGGVRVVASGLGLAVRPVPCQRARVTTGRDDCVHEASVGHVVSFMLTHDDKRGGRVTFDDAFNVINPHTVPADVELSDVVSRQQVGGC